VSPADGRVLHYGEIVGERVEQVKGLTYSLQALLGSEGAAVGERKEIPSTPLPESTPSSLWGFFGITSSETSEAEPDTASEAHEGKPRRKWSWKGLKWPSALRFRKKQKAQVVDDEHFANINDIPYSLSSLMGKRRAAEVQDPSLPEQNEEHDASHPVSDPAHDASVAVKLGKSAARKATDREHDMPQLDPNNKLWFLVVYLAPGDYHRFHSPTAWVVERRRHFTGDLFSVSPYIANRLRDLFVLNERVALLGRWQHGFYSMVPVGATNVGSIRINFDETLRTNTRKLSHPPHTFTEAVYTSASTILQGQPLLPGEEMGGFRLGSTIVLVFEAPKEWKFTVKAGDKVQVGEAIGRFKKPGEKDDEEDAAGEDE
jgi:phosphatidylserine decarboxylase